MHWTSVITDFDGNGDPIYDEVQAENAGLVNQSYRHFRIEQVGDYDADPSLPPPPYNPSGVPQVTFAFIDSCKSGDNKLFARILYPGRIYDYIPFENDPGPYAMNQAVLTWSLYAHPLYGAQMNTELWTRLTSGNTISKVRMDMILKNLSSDRSGGFLQVSATLENPQYRLVYQASDMPIWGDFYTRVHGVYTGSDDIAPNGWYL